MLLCHTGDVLSNYPQIPRALLKRTFELKDGKYESGGNSKVGALDETAIEDMIEIAKRIVNDYEHGFNKTKNESACRGCGYKL